MGTRCVQTRAYAQAFTLTSHHTGYIPRDVGSLRRCHLLVPPPLPHTRTYEAHDVGVLRHVNEGLHLLHDAVQYCRAAGVREVLSGGEAGAGGLGDIWRSE